MKSFFSNTSKKEKQSTKDKAIKFFGFYLIFFIGLAILFRVVPHNNVVNNNTIDENKFSIAKYNGYNYYYEYNFNIDNNNTNIKGMKFDDEENFTFNQVDYYKDKLDYYKDKVLISSPYEYLNIIDNLDNIINDSTYMSVTNYPSGKELYRYAISSASISKLIYNKDLDIEEIPNEIVYTIEGGHLSLIDINLDSYCIALKKCNKSFNLVIKYNKFGDVEEIIK